MGSKKSKSSNSFLVQGSVLAVAGIISRVIGVAYRIPLLNIMTLKGQGFYDVAFQIYQIALLLTSYSLPLAVSKMVSARMAKGQKKNAYRAFKTALLFAFLIGLITALIVFFGAEFIAAKIMSMSLSIYALQILAPCLVVVAVMGVMRGFFQGLGTMMPTAVTQILEQIVNAVVSLIGAKVMLGYGETQAVDQGNDLLTAAYAAAGGTMGTLAGALIGLLFLTFLFYAYKDRLKRRLRSDRSAHRESYRMIIKVMLLTIAPVILSTGVYNLQNILDNGIFNRIMLIQGLGEEEYSELSGKMSQFNTLLSVPLAIANALASSLIPSLVAVVQSGHRRKIHQKIHIVIRFTMLIAIPSAVGFFVLARPINDLFFHVDNSVQAMLMRIGAISVIFFCLSTVTNAILQGLNRMMAPVKNAAISLVIHLIVLIIALVVLKWNVYGVILSKTVFALCMCIMNAHVIRETCGYIQEQRRTFVIPGIASVIMGIVTFIMYLLLDITIGGYLATVIAVVIAIITYIISLLMLGGISADEILALPKGAKIVRMLERLHLLKKEYY
ncbi:MAG: putative polysaccharide biosynthesis protein [Lachnospiraceae bacterium]